MKNLFNKITKNAILPLVVAATFAFNSYSQKIEETENGFEEYNEKGQMIRGCEQIERRKVCWNYKYDEKGNLIEEIWNEDYENDGKIDYVSQSNWIYGENTGKEIKKIKQVDYENDGEFDDIEQTNYKYNKKGEKIKSKDKSEELAK